METRTSGDEETFFQGDLTRRIIGAAIEVHKTLGPGLLDSIYEECLVHELGSNGLSLTRQAEVPIVYKTMVLERGYRIDLIVEDAVIVEVKAVERLVPVHEAQLMTYLRLTQRRVGLVLNFNSRVLKDGIIRRVL
jgi:GxxExxY protein